MACNKAPHTESGQDFQMDRPIRGAGGSWLKTLTFNTFAKVGFYLTKNLGDIIVITPLESLC